ncbi:MAG: hypothetical protein LBH85_08835 [Treponema sp.]|jgi:uncharacterized membrane protein|nr:hypothetical protein [Treponema sp.]
MNIEAAIKRAFEKEVEQCQAPEYRPVVAPVHREKRRRENYGALALCLFIASALAMVSLKTGVLRSPVITLADIINVMPENFTQAFGDWLYALHFF